jgi:adenylate cyclase
MRKQGGGRLRYLFQDCVLDTDLRELRRGAEAISIAPQVFDLLEYLIRNQARVVSKDDLIAAVWNGRIVSDAALTTRLNVARSAIGDNGEDQRLIRTLRGKGFRFVGAVLEQQSPEACLAPALPLPDRPSIAVLPFGNMSGDPEQEYFADGITEDLITELSRFRSLFVIARNSCFFYKGRNIRMQDVARDLGVGYLTEGSVRKSDKRVRITVQLVNAKSGNHVWAQRFDRDLEDVFAVQNEVVQSIVAMLTRRLEAADLDRVNRTQSASLMSYDYVLRAKHHHHRVTEEDNAQALKMVEMALALDPHHAQAHAWLACILGQAMHRGFIAQSSENVKRAFEAAEVARSLDDNDAECHRILCEINLIRRDHARARYHQERALSLNPNDPRMVAQRGHLLTWLGQASEAVEWIEKALRLDPAQPDDYYVKSLIVLHAARRYRNAAEAFSRVAKPQYFTHAHVAACLAELGDVAGAQAHVAEVVRLRPTFAVRHYAGTLPFKSQADRDHVRFGMIKAGLPK